jgi:hypothetical protein
MKTVQKNRLKPLVSNLNKKMMLPSLLKRGLIEEIRARLPSPAASSDPQSS